MATNARLQQLLNQRKNLKGLGNGSIRILSPYNSSVTTIAKQTTTNELNVMVNNYNAGTVSNQDMLSFLTKMQGNMALSSSDRISIDAQIRDFNSRLQSDKLTSTYKAAAPNSLAQIQAAQALSQFYKTQAASFQLDTPAYATAMDNASQYDAKITSVTDSLSKTARLNARYSQMGEINKIADPVKRNTELSSMWNDLAQMATDAGDSTASFQYTSNANKAATDAQTESDKATTAANKKTASDYINTTINDYHDGKISGDEALTQLEQADQFAYATGDTAAQNRLNSLSLTINSELDKGITYSNVNGLSQKTTGGGSSEPVMNPDGSISYGYTPGKTIGTGGSNGSGLGGQVTDSKGINPLIQKYFPKEQWVTAQAVMLAESGGNTQAVGDNYPINGETIPSYGLFQIRGLPGRPDANTLLTPEQNVKYAAQLWSQSGWQPWSAYTNGSYKQYTGQAGAKGNGDTISVPSGNSFPGNSAAGIGLDKPKSFPELDFEYKSDLTQANQMLLTEKAPDGTPFTTEDYKAVLEALAKRRQLQLQTITDWATGIVNANGASSKVGKAALDVVDKYHTELQQVTANYNGIVSGGLVLKMTTSNGVPSIGWDSKSNVVGMIESGGIYHPTYTRDVLIGDQKAYNQYLSDHKDLANFNPSDAKLGADGQYYYTQQVSDIYDTSGRKITYENNPKYGWIPVAAGPITSKLRDSIIAEADRAAETGHAYTPKILNYNDVVNYDYTNKPSIGATATKLTQPSFVQKAGDLATRAANAIVPDTSNAVPVAPVAPKPVQQLNLPSNIGVNLPSQPQSNPSFTATAPKINPAAPSTPLKLATQAPSPIAQMNAGKPLVPLSGGQPTKVTPVVQQQQPNALVNLGTTIGKTLDTGIKNLKKLFGW